MSGGKVLLASTLRGGWIVRMTGCEKEGSILPYVCDES